jgi:hypothetical protein
MKIPLFRNIAARYKTWLRVIPVVLVVVFLCLWVDSISHVRRFIFLPGGDVGLGFRSAHGALQWVEYAPWEAAGRTDYVRLSIPYSLVVLAWLIICFLLLLKPRRPFRVTS